MSKFIKITLIIFLLFSCSVNKTLDGTWENEEKIIYFDSIQKKFVIINKKANEIVGFAGEFDFDKYSDSISLTYLYLINNKNDFFMIENNSHEKFHEQLQYNIKNEKLELYNKSWKIIFFYKIKSRDSFGTKSFLITFAHNLKSFYNIYMKHTTEITVRSYECDSYNHVNNAVYLNYLEHSRMDYLHAIGFDYKGIVEAGYSLYVTHIDIYYKGSAFLDDKLFVETTPTKLKHVMGEFKQIIKKEDGTVCAEATVTWASVTTEGRPSKIPEKFMVDGLKPETN